MKHVRQVRLVAGLVLAGYVTAHFFNHTFALFSFEAADAVRRPISAFWHTWAGTVLLFGSLVVHASLALFGLYQRTTLRMSRWEMVQMVLGLLIVPLGFGHMVGLRINASILEMDSSYLFVIASFAAQPGVLVSQVLLTLAVWVHMVVGIHFWLRVKTWYPRALPILYPLAVLLPVLGSLGPVRAGLGLGQVPAPAMAAAFEAFQSAPATHAPTLAGIVQGSILAFVGLLVATFGAREVRRIIHHRRGAYRIHHASGRVITAPRGRTVLEAVRHARIPHAAVCGGRGRCTTCRIRVGTGLNELPPPDDVERAALDRIGAEGAVRLACQLRPTHDLHIVPLLSVHASPRQANVRGGVRGREQQVTSMFVDLRDSTKLGEERMPYDVVFILNLFFGEMSAALEETDGHYAQFSGDGLLALYGLEGTAEEGARHALDGVVAIGRRLDQLNQRLGPELGHPLRVGIGIHSGEAIVGTMGPPSSPNLSAIGDNVNIAARLESLCKSYGCGVVVSKATLDAAGISPGDRVGRAEQVRGRKESIEIYTFGDPDDLAAHVATQTQPS